ncbi:MAG: glutathione S-transferase family protein [Betaproteobacteria bacterium]|nr:glutathione S-transferase family protein [Betaproteobacteria bacterium]
MTLVIGNKNYSSWSMRPWVLMRQAQIPFEEIQLWFDDEARPRGIGQYSPAGQVPVLLVDGAPVWDSLAICETLAELFPEKRLWPEEAGARAHARAVCAEMHAGFRSLREAMPMNIRASHPRKGMSDAVAREIARVSAIWSECRGRFGEGGALLFGKFTVPDAYYAPVVMRFLTYVVSLPPLARDYVEAVRGLPSVTEWMDAACRETAFVAADEPYAAKS